jgi:myo-inositol catabolism protein IolC
MNFQSLGYTKPLYILPFDHRNTFASKMFNLRSLDELNQEQIDLVKEFKMLIYKGFKDAILKNVPKDFGAILCDEQFSSEALLDARRSGVITILTIEKSGEKEFKFQYEDFRNHIQKFRPTFTKVLLNYNPKDPEDSKERQKTNLKIISDYSHESGYKFLLEVLVNPTQEQSLKVSDSREEFDLSLRPGLTVEVIKDFQKSGIEADVWKLEGLERQEDYLEIVKAAKANGRDNVGIVVLGRGANQEKVNQWLKVGSQVKGVIGFAVGRTVFWDPIEKFYHGQIGNAQVIETISANYQKFYKIFSEKY